MCSLSDDKNRKVEESRLIEMLKEGDSLSFEILFQQYYVCFYNFVCNLIKDSQAAEDIVQNVFMKIWCNRRNLCPDQSIRSYIYVLTKNEVYNHIRDRKIHMQVEELLMSDSSVTVATDEMFHIKDLDSRIRRFIAEMPLQRRKVFLMIRSKAGYSSDFESMFLRILFRGAIIKVRGVLSS